MEAEAPGTDWEELDRQIREKQRQRPLLPSSICESYATIALAKLIPRESTRRAFFSLRSGIGAENAEWLRTEILAATAREECTIGQLSAYGQRYSVEFTLRKNEKQARVRSAWIVRTGEGFPRLISCYVI